MRERLAALAHRQWSGWVSHLFDQCTFNEDGTVTIPADRVLRWLRQVATPYDLLSEDEKDLDRHEADRVIRVMLTRIATMIALGLEAE